jgi:LPS export ABC transporter protein LptC
MDRKRLIVIASVVVFAALLSWLSRWLSLPERPMVSGMPTTPDYYIDGMHVTHMDKRGRKKFEVIAAKLVHFPKEKQARLHDVYLIQYQPDGVTVQTRADNARYPDSGKEIHMENNVHIIRKRSGKVLDDIRANRTDVYLKK